MEDKEKLKERIQKVIGDRKFEAWAYGMGWKFRFPMYQGAAYMQEAVDALDLTQRSYNCLKRAGFQTVDDVVDGINSREDLLKVRNLGKKSADEIMLKLFLYQYSQLKPERQEKYKLRILELNGTV